MHEKRSLLIVSFMFELFTRSCSHSISVFKCKLAEFNFSKFLCYIWYLLVIYFFTVDLLMFYDDVRDCFYPFIIKTDRLKGSIMSIVYLSNQADLGVVN